MRASTREGQLLSIDRGMGSSKRSRPGPQAVSKQWDTAPASSKLASSDGPLKYRNAIIVAAAAFVLLSLLSLTSSDHGPVQLSVGNSAQLKDVLYGGEPWIVLCDKSPVAKALDKLPSHRAFADAAEEVGEKLGVRAGVLDCTAKLSTGQSVFRRFKFAKRKKGQPLAFFVGNGNKPVQAPPAKLDSAKKFAKWVKWHEEPRVVTPPGSKTVHSRCFGKRACAVLLRHGSWNSMPIATVAAVRRLARSNRLLRFLYVDTSTHVFKTPEADLPLLGTAHQHERFMSSKDWLRVGMFKRLPNATEAEAGASAARETETETETSGAGAAGNGTVKLRGRQMRIGGTLLDPVPSGHKVAFNMKPVEEFLAGWRDDGKFTPLSSLVKLKYRKQKKKKKPQQQRPPPQTEQDRSEQTRQQRKTARDAKARELREAREREERARRARADKGKTPAELKRERERRAAERMDEQMKSQYAEAADETDGEQDDAEAEEDVSEEDTIDLDDEEEEDE